MDADLVISNGHIVTPATTFVGDVGIVGTRITAITLPKRIHGAKIIDASGKYVFPGLIDPHIHFHMWERPFEEDCLSETPAAASGGVTTMGIMVLNRDDASAKVSEHSRGRLDTIPDYQQIWEEHSVVDGYLYVGLPTENVEERIQANFKDGISLFKVVWGIGGRRQISDAVVFRAFRQISQLPFPVRALVHCEDIDICNLLEKEMAKTGRLDPEALNQARPAFSEADCMQRYIRIAEATACPLYIVHITIGEGPDIIANAKNHGVDIVGETCPQYLTHTTEQGGIFINNPQLARVYPPLRDKNSNERLWQGLQEGIIEVVGTDHSPRKLEEKGSTIWEGPPGLGNLTELLLPVLYSEGVNKGRLSLEQLVRVSSYNTAKVLGLYPKKGSISVGSDADLVILDPNKRVVLSPRMLHSRCDYSIYDGWEFTGWPVCTILRGQVIAQDGEIVGKPGSGKCLSLMGEN